jgi:hypothetical protein
MQKIFYIFLILLSIFIFSGCFMGGHINSSGQVGMSVGGAIF